MTIAHGLWEILFRTKTTHHISRAFSRLYPPQPNATVTQTAGKQRWCRMTCFAFTVDVAECSGLCGVEDVGCIGVFHDLQFFFLGEV